MSKTKEKKSLFGAGLFSKKKKEELQKLYDFAQHGVLNNPDFQQFNSNDFITWNVTSTSVTGWDSSNYIVPQISPEQKKKNEAEAKAEKEKEFTPKELYEMKVLNQVPMSVKCDEQYIKETTDLLRRKLKMFTKNEGATKYGRLELESLIERIENRKNFKKYEKLINEYPHTTSEAIGSLLNKEKYLRCKDAEEFLPDFPKDAIDAMEAYKDLCLKLCNKLPVFYVIANKKDFGEIDKKRDPILLAQSPFGFVWQILGAWDEEMVFLGDL